jgi:hypothetical protein
MRAKSILALAFVFACSSKHSTTGDDAPNGTDSSTIDSPTSGDAGGDGMSNVDASVGVACGMTTCMGTQECCLANGTRSCVDAGKCTGIAFTCDGPEDCPANDVCCAGNTGGMPGSKCEPKTDVCRAVACHADNECPTAQPKCCALGQQSELKICLAQCPMM